MNLELLKQILAIPTCSHKEQNVIRFLLKWAVENKIDARVDAYGNVYMTKGRAEYWPCVAAHTDSVHDLKPVEIRQDGDFLTAWDSDGQQCGLGGDDKAGVFICLQILEKLPVCKAAFFVGEEVFCHGSFHSDPIFFRDVGYLIEFDSPCENIMSYSNRGEPNFPNSGPFIDKVLPLLDEHGVTEWQDHPYTDTFVMRQSYRFCCLNLPGGYFRMHSPFEYVSISAVQNSLRLGIRVIEALGEDKYDFHFVNVASPRAVTGLHTHDHKDSKQFLAEALTRRSASPYSATGPLRVGAYLRRFIH